MAAAKSNVLIFILAFLVVAASSFALGYFFGASSKQTNPEIASGGNVSAPSPVPSVEITPSPAVSPSPVASVSPEIAQREQPEPTPATETKDASQAVVVPPDALLIPVVGVRPEQLQDTFTQSRSEGRTHNALDIMAPRGATVVAADNGEIKFFDSDKGGITIYQINRDKKLVYYYAHLDRRADGLQENVFIKKGALLGYVGDTGNAGAGNYHLHFAIWTLDDPRRHWEGTNINPYPLLKNSK